MAEKTTIGAANPLMVLRGEVDRLFDTFFPAALGRSLFDIAPHMDVCERADGYDVSVELPGLEQADVTVTVHGDMLTIAGEKKTEQSAGGGALRVSERSYGSFLRSVRLPADVDEEAVTADFAKGVLTVRLPKRAGVMAEKKIEVSTH